MNLERLSHMAHLDVKSPVPQKAPKHVHLKDALKRRILSGEYAIGDRLPSEAELMRDMGVSRHTILRGLSALAAEGWINRHQGRGTFVARRDGGRGTDEKTVALICSDQGDALMGRMIRGISRALRAHRRELLVLDSDHDADRESELLQTLPDRGIGGALLWTLAPTRNRDVIRQLEAQNYPLVLIDRSVEGCGLPVVCVDHELGAYEVTKHLIGLGHRRIAHITFHSTSDAPVAVVAAREAGFRRALTEADIECEPWMVERVNPTLMRLSHEPSLRQVLAYEQAHRLFARNDRPTAIFMLNDVFYASVLAAATNQGLRVPDDVAIAGFNNDPEAWHQPVPLTTYDQPTEEMGYVATELLRNLAGGERVEPREHRLQGKLVTRASTAFVGHSA